MAVGLVAAACSAGDDASPTDSDPTPAPAVETSSPGATTTEPAPAPTAAPTTDSTTTTVPPPEILPLGQVWSPALLDAGSLVTASDAAAVGDELWVVGRRWNGPAAWRTVDGAEWAEVAIAGPPDSGAVSLDGVVARPGGGYLVWGHAGSSCPVALPRDNGYVETGICKRSRPVVFLSDDGATWRRVDPPSMQPGGGASVFIDDLTAVADGFVAVGTHRSPDWYTIVWFSPDGENWERVDELRGVDGPMSGHEVLWDGNTLVLLTQEHPCSQGDINDNTPGWILGSQWADHLRMFAGSNVLELAPVDPEGHPLLEPPMPVDCSVDDAFFLAMEPYPDAQGAVIGGTITLVDTTPLPQPDDSETDTEDEEAEEEINPRRLVALVDGTWEETIVEGFDRGSDLLVEVDDGPALLRVGQATAGLSSTELLRPDSSGEAWTALVGDRPVIGRFVQAAAGYGDAVVLVTRSEQDPFETSIDGSTLVELFAWSTSDTAEDDVVRCVPEPGGACPLPDFAALDDYPDLSGQDFSGADLKFATFGVGDYSDATFAGSNLSGATVEISASPATFVGADFTGAILRGADLEDLAGANLAGADVTAASIGFSAVPASLEGTNLAGTRLEAIRDADGDYQPLELALAGYDLTRSDIRGPLGDDEPMLRITDLQGSILDDITFYKVDLTGVLLDDGADLSTARVWDNSICPDGEPPTDGPIGTCVRP